MGRDMTSITTYPNTASCEIFLDHLHHPFPLAAPTRTSPWPRPLLANLPFFWPMIESSILWPCSSSPLQHTQSTHAAHTLAQAPIRKPQHSAEKVNNVRFAPCARGNCGELGGLLIMKSSWGCYEFSPLVRVQTPPTRPGQVREGVWVRAWACDWLCSGPSWTASAPSHARLVSLVWNGGFA